MNFPKGIEGDYIETSDDNLFFDVKGVHHPKERLICFLRFVPDPTGNRLRKGIQYTKIYELSRRYDFLRKNYPDYLFYSPGLDLEVQGVQRKKIKKIYTPWEYFRDLAIDDKLNDTELISKKLCELLISEGSVPFNSIGITGSPMIGLNTADSDIDLIIYGTKVSLELQEKLPSIFARSSQLRKYLPEEFKTHYNWRAGGSGVAYADFLTSEKRKLHQGKFHGKEFFIRYLKSPKDWKGQFSDYNFKDCGRIRLKAKIVDSKDSIFTPCSYKISVNKIFKKFLSKDWVDPRNIKEITSFRGRFIEHAKKGEEVLAVGKLEKVSFQEKEEWFRILLTSQENDQLIVIN
ncbi:MAG: hypothetical protein GF353_21940 [Candidatus Lokiarchaeota archaeon]|nr:hypothetical protein [Candidatus Lokiarchaeota archaeon]